MRSYKKAFGNAIVMWIVGAFPIFFSVIYSIIDKDENHNSIAMAISLFMGGLLAVLVMSVEYKVRLKNYVIKPRANILLLVVLTAFFYMLCIMFIVYRNVLSGEPDGSVAEVIYLVLASTIAPIGEELIFRFAMLTLLLLASNGSAIKRAVSIVLISAAWMIMHFPSSFARFADLMATGIIIGFIYLKSGNIIYSIVFHITANATVYTLACFYKQIYAREYLFYISLALFIVCGVLLLVRLNRMKNDEAFLQRTAQMSPSRV